MRKLVVAACVLLACIQSPKAQTSSDVTGPAVKIVSPKLGGVYSESSLTLTGTVADASGVTSIAYNLNGAEFNLDGRFVANGKPTNYSAIINLKPGTNNLTVVGVDGAGNNTTVNSRFFYHTSQVLTVEKTLDGSSPGEIVVGHVLLPTPVALQGSVNGTNDLFIGRTYTAKVLEAGLPHYILTNWTATWEGQATPVVLQTNNLTCVFEMKRDMVLKANFISNPFYRYGGSYAGLFSLNSGLSFKSSGFAQLKVTPRQGVSGKLFVDGNVIGFSGKLNIDGSGAILTKTRTKRTDKPELWINLALDFANGSETINGTINELGGWTSSSLRAYRATWTTNSGEQAIAYTNSYTLLLPGNSDGTVAPPGSSFATITVDKIGRSKAVGYTADGHVLKAGSTISRNGHWPFFSPQYKTSRLNELGKISTETEGFVIGWLHYATNSLGNVAPTGQLHWINTGWTNSTYAAGFTNVADVKSSRWIAPVSKSGIRTLNMTSVPLSFTGGGLADLFRATYFLTTNTTLAEIKLPEPQVYPNSLQASLAPKTGLLKGTFIHQAASATPTKWFGAMLQDQVEGGGFFMGPTTGGNVTAKTCGPSILAAPTLPAGKYAFITRPNGIVTQLSNPGSTTPINNGGSSATNPTKVSVENYYDPYDPNCVGTSQLTYRWTVKTSGYEEGYTAAGITGTRSAVLVIQPNSLLPQYYELVCDIMSSRSPLITTITIPISPSGSSLSLAVYESCQSGGPCSNPAALPATGD